MKNSVCPKAAGHFMHLKHGAAQLFASRVVTSTGFFSKAFSLMVCLLGVFSAHQAQAVPTIYTLGDSTVQTYASSAYPRAGWGQVLPFFFDSTKVAVVNKAVGGTSAKSYYDTQWAAVKSLLKAGDYVTIGFGINDAATDAARHTDPFTTFKSYLTLFVNETKAKGAFPIIVATQPRNTWYVTNPPTVYPAYHDYPVASRQLAASLGVPLIDLDQRGIALLQTVGKIYSTNFIYHNYLPGEWPNYPNGVADDVHFQEMGAIEMAKLVVAGIRSLSGNANVSKLIPFLKPTYKVTFNSNNSAWGMYTRTEYFPAGITVTAYARPNSGYAFSNWSGGLSGTKRNLSFTMGTAAKTITATFQTAPVTPPIPNGTYSLINVASNKMLDSLGATADGATIAQWADGTSNNQKWVLTNVSGAVYSLSCVAGGKCLDSMGHTDNGSTVCQWTAGTSPNQRWTVVAVGAYYKIINVANGKCLDTGGSTANGGVMQFWSSSSSNNQLWLFVAP